MFGFGGVVCDCAAGGCDGELCVDENFALMLDIHEFRLDTDLESGGVSVALFSELDRPRSVGRFGGVFVGFTTGDADTGGGDGGFSIEGTVPLETCASSRWPCGRPPWVDVRGGASLARPGDDGACRRW